jgi:2-polyprenyl-3-methyl-5-hydroxy-6-metoxy-1,4-benzoquinol methylase
MLAETAIPKGFELVPCPNCGSDHSTTAREGRDWVLDPSRTITIVKCDACGLHFTNPRPDEAHLPAYYGVEYNPYNRHEKKDRAGIAQSTRDTVLRWAYGSPSKKPGAIGTALAKLITTIQPLENFGFGVPYQGRGRLLDFGCASGRFVARMASLGWDAMGIDFTEDAIQPARKEGLKVVWGTLPHPDLAPESFDVVTLRASLEHVHNPADTLREVHKLLAPGGKVVIQVPNYDCWEIDYFGDAAQVLNLPRHLTHFTADTLTDTLTRSGYTNVKIEQKSRANWLRISLKQVERRGKPMPLDKKLKSSKFAKQCAKQALKDHKGNELLAIAEKPS